MERLLSLKNLRLTLTLTIIVALFVAYIYSKNNQNLGRFSECSSLVNTAQLQCWESAIEQTLQKQGLDKAFDLLDYFYKTEPQFTSSCHSFTHKLGQAAYYIFVKQKSINLTEKAAYCGYGFYHGFMETLLEATGNLEEARSFCNMVDSSLVRLSARSIGHCYHGIGHGAVDGSDPRAWGRVDAMIAPGLTICQKVSTNEKDLYLCGTGVFNSLAIMMNANQYGIKPNEKDPYELCSTFQQNSFKESCYHQMNTVVIKLGNNQLKQAARYVEKIIDDSYAVIAMRGLALTGAFAYLTKSDFSEYILDCQSLQPRLQIACIDSFAEGLMEVGSPTEGYVKAFAVCQLPLLTTGQRESCFQSSLAYLKKISTLERFKAICQKIDKSFRPKRCTQNFILSSPPKIVELTDSGFNPSEISIRSGDTVRFVNKTNKPFWPASNLHPTHNIYPEFDPKEPIESRGSWSFRFEKEGVWKYHDHLVTFYKGTIIVGKNDNISSTYDKQSCNKLIKKNQKKICWQSLLENTLNKSGLEEGFRLFRELAQLEPNDCHQYAHDLGGYAFKAYSLGKKIQINQEASYCGYGFWHGFMSKMIADSNLEQAKQFCESITNPAPELIPVVRNHCSHGIGIGMIPDPPPIKFWGEAQPLIEPALRYCDTLQGEESIIESCHSGVFHAVIIYMQKEQYKFNFNHDNPFALCFSQKEKYRTQCYFQIAPRLADITNHNLLQAFKLLKQIPDTRIFQQTSMPAFAKFINQQMSEKDQINFLKRCHSLGTTVSELCISSLILGLFKDGIPEKEYLKAIALCSSKNLSVSDRSICYDKVVSSSKQLYSANKMHEICNAIERNYHKIC